MPSIPQDSDDTDAVRDYIEAGKPIPPGTYRISQIALAPGQALRGTGGFRAKLTHYPYARV